MARALLCHEILSIVPGTPVDFDWDDWQSRSYFHYADVAELERLKGLTGHANIALAIATCEWVEARYRGAGLDPQFSEYLDIAWAAMLDRSVTGWIHLDYENWRGAVRKPQLLSMGIINEAYFEYSDNSEMAWRACYALNLARYILPRKCSFPEWYAGVIDRLEAAHSWTTDGEHPVDIFDSEVCQGNPVSREVFDLQRPYDPLLAGPQLRAYSLQVDSNNRYRS
jgi:hypothetical protein